MSGLSVYRIHANELNPRKDLGDVNELAENIRENGFLEPITLTPCNCEKIEGAHFRILNGHRRYKTLFILHHLTLSNSEYKVYENLSREQEMALVFDTNIERKQYTPLEMYTALNMKRGYGKLRGLARSTGMGYYEARVFLSIMDRLAPEVRERVAWRGGLTVRQARELAKVSHEYQGALAEARLSSAQLRAAVDLIKERPGVITPEEAIRKARLSALKVTTEDKVSAAFLAADIAIINGVVRTDDLVRLGFGARTAKRTLKRLESGNLLKAGSVDPDVWKFLQARDERNCKRSLDA